MALRGAHSSVAGWDIQGARCCEVAPIILPFLRPIPLSRFGFKCFWCALYFSVFPGCKQFVFRLVAFSKHCANLASILIGGPHVGKAGIKFKNSVRPESNLMNSLNLSIFAKLVRPAGRAYNPPNLKRRPKTLSVQPEAPGQAICRLVLVFPS